MEKKYLTLPFTFKNVDDAEYHRFEGYASTFGNVDYGNDVVMRGAFSSLRDKNPRSIKLLYQHDMTKPLGVYDEIREDEKGLFVKGRMPKDNSNVRDVASLMKCGAIDSLSVGYIPVDYEYNDKGHRLLKNIDLKEISLVTMPMNPQAAITDMKGVSGSRSHPLADTGRVWDSKNAVQRVREFTESTDAPSAKFKSAFMWYDSKNPDVFASYKLPFVDIINGKMYAIPRAIYAIAAVLDGGRGGVKIPDSDKAKIKSIVESYYKKMDMESPFKDSEDEKEEDYEDFNEDWVTVYAPSKSSTQKREAKKIFVEDVKFISSKKEFEKCLRESGVFSISAAVKLASFFNCPSESDNTKLQEQMFELKNLINKL